MSPWIDMFLCERATYEWVNVYARRVCLRKYINVTFTIIGYFQVSRSTAGYLPTLQEAMKHIRTPIAG